MIPILHSLTFSGEMLRRGFWLYLWEIRTPEQAYLYYAGRTGDSSSVNAQSPFNRMGQHLGFNDKNNVLRRHLQGRGVAPEKCDFRLVAYGPLLEEAATLVEHRELRDVISALEKALAEAMTAAGYTVINTIRCRLPLDEKRFKDIKTAFAIEFPNLASRKTNL
jgi:hypothetical protein